MSPDEGPVAWSPDSTVLAKAHDDTIWLFPMEQGRPVGTLPVQSGSAGCLDWSVKGELAWVTAAGELRVSTDLKTSRVVATNAGGRCTWSHDGDLIATAGCCDEQHTGLTVMNRQGEIVARRENATVAYNFGWTDRIAWSPDDERIAIVEGGRGGSGGKILIADITTAGADHDVALPDPENDFVSSLSWTPDGTGVHAQISRSQYVLTMSDFSLRKLAMPCACRILSPLATGQLLAFTSVPVDGFDGIHRGLAVLEPDLGKATTVVVARGPRNTNSYECAGSYLTGKWSSPDDTLVAFRVRASWGPRCDSPSF